VEVRRKKISFWNGIVGSCGVDLWRVIRCIGGYVFLIGVGLVQYVQSQLFVVFSQVVGVIWACGWCWSEIVGSSKESASMKTPRK
jgi:hypothetical protein